VGKQAKPSSSGCQIISMSLGSATEAGEPFSNFDETVAQRILDQGTLIIAAAGNQSERIREVIKLGQRIIDF
jgi:subtilisin